MIENAGAAYWERPLRHSQQVGYRDYDSSVELRRMGEHLITIASVVFVVAVPAAFVLVV